MIGRVIGSFQIVEKLGEGGMGAVFKALDLMLDREVAVKVLRPELTGQPDVVERFRNEAITLAKLHHPNIATLYSLLRDGGEMMMVMEFVHGETLERLLGQFGAIAAGTAVSWCCQVLDAMQYAHRKGVIHRDIKPANLMVTSEGAIKVTDFGIARVLGESRRTRTGHIIGTIAYMAPEQIRGQDIDVRTDLYALGAVLFELLTGRQLFVTGDDFSLMTAQVTEPAPLARSIVPGIPDWLDSAMQRVLSKAPGDRFQTAGEFRALLAEGLQNLPLPTDSRLIEAVAHPVTADAATPPQSAIPPTRLAGAPGPPPTRLAVKETRLGTAGDSAPQAPDVRGATPPAARPSFAIVGQLNWRHYAGAGAVVVMLAALAAAWLRPASTPGSQAGQPPPTLQAAAPAAAKPAPAVTPLALEADRPPVEQPPPPSTRAPIMMPPSQQEKPPPVPLTERRRSPSTTAPGGPPAPVPVSPPPEQAPTPPVAVQPPPAEAPRPVAGTRAAEHLPDARYDRVAWVVAEGDAKDETEVVIEFRRDGVEILPLDEEVKGKTLAYSSIVGMTYSQTEPPRWKKLLRLGSSHWLTVKTRNDTAVLHLDSRNYKTIVEALEARTGLKVQR